MNKYKLGIVLGIMLGSAFVIALYNTVLVDYTTVTYLPDGGKYVGERKGNLFHGSGSIEWPDGTIYSGEFVEGVMQGTGEQTFANGDRYSGEFRRGAFHGKGEYVTAEQDIYAGEFVDGSFTGEGSLEYANGFGFNGTFKDWQYSGKGTMVYASGDKYIGDFSEGSLNGYGVYNAADGSRYEGGFEYGDYDGEGEYWGKDGSHYQGGFDGGGYHGHGTYTFSNGDIYVGEFEYGRFHGKGELTYKDPKDGMASVRGTWQRGLLSACEDSCNIMPEDQIAEVALYNQVDLLNSQIAGIKNGNNDQIDLYFLGVAGYGSQAVFRREVLYAKDHFDTHFDTAGRSVALINDRSTVEDYPLATATSVDKALQGLTNKMDLNEDILFVFLSSHGSDDHYFSIRQPGLKLKDIGAAQFAGMIKGLPVKWKVIVVSSCYAGGHIPHLEDDNTLIITAAASDKTSFGCSDENQFTYFGEAFFKDALSQSDSFVDAFTKAKEIVTAREKADDYEPSNPQISQPDSIVTQLKRWRAILANRSISLHATSQ